VPGSGKRPSAFKAGAFNCRLLLFVTGIASEPA